MHFATARPQSANATRLRRIEQIKNRCNLEKLRVRDRLLANAQAAADRGDTATASYFRNESRRLANAAVRYANGHYTVDPPPSRTGIGCPAAAVDLAAETAKRRALLEP